MFVNKILNKSMIDISDEAYEHYKAVNDGIESLSNASEMGWNLTQSDLFDKALRVSKFEGFVLGAVAVGAIVGVSKLVKKRKNKTEE